MEFFVNEKFRATDTDALEHVNDVRHELNIINGTSQTVMTEVTGATVIRLATRTTYFTIVQHTHTRVKEATDLRLIALMRDVGRDLHHRAPFNLLRREDTELNADDGLNVRSMLVKSVRHSVLSTETVV